MTTATMQPTRQAYDQMIQPAPMVKWRNTVLTGTAVWAPLSALPLVNTDLFAVEDTIACPLTHYTVAELYAWLHVFQAVQPHEWGAVVEYSKIFCKRQPPRVEDFYHDYKGAYLWWRDFVEAVVDSERDVTEYIKRADYNALCDTRSEELRRDFIATSSYGCDGVYVFRNPAPQPPAPAY